MKYTVFINQRAAIENEFDLDFNDLAIFDLMKDAANGPRIKKMFFDNSTFFEFRWKWIIQQLPLLRIKTRQGINKRLQKLIDCELVVGYPNNSSENTAFYKFGKNYDLLIFSKSIRDNESLQGVNESLQGVNESLQECKKEFTGGVNESLHNKKVINKKVIKSNKTIKNKTFVAPSISEVISFFKQHNQPAELATKAFNHYQIADWHDARGKKVINWKQKMNTNWFQEAKPSGNQRSLFNQSTVPVSNYSLHDDEEANESF